MDWKQLIETVAPTLGLALGGPFGGMAAKIVSQTLLGKDVADDIEMEKAVMMASPEDIANIKKADYDFKTKMAEIDVDLKKIASDDRANARSREIQTKDNAPKILACVIVMGFFSVLYTIAFVEIPDSAMQPINILLGALTAMLTQVGNYYFGSSAGSKAKNDLLGKR